MTIGQRLAEGTRSSHLDALPSAVPLNLGMDVVHPVLAGAMCRGLGKCLPGHDATTPGTSQRRFLPTSGVILNCTITTVVRLNRRTYSLILRRANIAEVQVTWWGGRRLHFEEYA